MRGLIICFVAIFLFEASVARANPPASPSDKYEKVIQQIANDIGALKTEYPMLSKFDTEQNVDLNALSIEYAHNTESSKVNAGWRAGVPAPEKNGVWFYIDLHDVGSSKQLHTQPLSAGLYCYAGKLVAILILQGAKTKPFSKPLMEILHRNGVRPCAG